MIVQDSPRHAVIECRRGRAVINKCRVRATESRNFSEIEGGGFIQAPNSET